MNRRLMQSILQNKKVLEIGPYLRPFIRSSNVKYLDVLSLEELKFRAQKTKWPYSEETAPKTIHYVIKDEDWSVIKEKFDAVFSSHCIEHQMNFIRHLQNVSNVLIDGAYYLCVPDKRYCVDYYKPNTNIGDLIDRHNNSTLTFSQYISKRWNTHNDCKQHGGTTEMKFLHRRTLRICLRNISI